MSDTTDASSFFAALNNFEHRLHGAAVKTVEHVAEAVMAESKDIVPVSPTDPKHPLYIGTSGSLRDSGVVGDVQHAGKEVFVELGYHTGPTAKDNADYAAAVHERTELNHQYPGAVNPRAQAKFLSIPLMDAKDKLIKVGAEYAREAMR